MKNLALLAALLFCLPSVLWGQNRLSRSGEFRVNATTQGDQTRARIASSAQGDFIVVWEGPDGNGTGVFAQRYTAAGSLVGTEFRVNSQTVNDQKFPSVAMAPDGRYVVVWGESIGGSFAGVNGVLYRADGTVEREFVASGAQTGPLFYPSVAMDAMGSFVVAYQSGSGSDPGESSYAHRFSANGSPLGGAILIDSTASLPQVAATPSGEFVVAYYGFGPTFGNSIFAKRYQADGTLKGDRFTVAAGSPSLVNDSPSVAVRSDGAFVIVWQSIGGSDFASADTSGYGCFGRRYTADGTSMDTAGPFLINNFTGGSQSCPSVVFSDNGEFTVSYYSNGFDGSGDAVALQRFGADDVLRRIGEEEKVNTFSAGDQQTMFGNRSIATDPQGNLIVVWRSAGQDGSGFGVYADKLFLPPLDLKEFRVNSTTVGDQTSPAVAMNASGQAVIAWESSDGNGKGIVAQRYDPDGRRVGTEIQVNTVTTGDQEQPAVGIDSSGNFAVVWRGVQQESGNDGIYLRRFLGNGTPDPVRPLPERVNQLVVSSVGGGYVVQPGIAVSPTGRFVVYWTGTAMSGVYAESQVSAYRVFPPDGPPGNEDFITLADVDAAVQAGGSYLTGAAFTAGDSFALCWSYEPQGNVRETYTRFHEANGSPRTTKGTLVTTVGDLSSYPKVCFNAAGYGLVVWRIRDLPGNFTNDARGRIINPDGSLGSFTPLINSATYPSLSSPNIAPLASNGFVVAYSGDGIDGDGAGVALQRIGNSGAKNGSETVVNFTKIGNQRAAIRGNIASDSIGNYMATWTSENQDGSGLGVYAAKVIVIEPPSITTLPAESVSATRATLHASIDPNGLVATVAFEYDEDENFGSPSVAQVPGSLSGVNPQEVAIEVTQGLSKGTTYYFRAKATVGAQVIFGDALQFTAANAAPVATHDAFFVAGQDQTLNVLANDSDPDLPADTLSISDFPQNVTVMLPDSTQQVVGQLNRVTLNGRNALSFTAGQGFVDAASFEYTVRDSDGLTSNALVDLYSFKALGGTYSGSISDDAGNEPVGLLRLTVNATAGRFTGVLFWAGGSYPVDSIFSLDGSVTLGVPGTALQFTLRAVDPLVGTITGTLTDNSDTSNPIIASIVLAREDGGGSGDDSTKPTPGTYTTFIDDPTIIQPSEVAGLRGTRGTTVDVPGGTGYSVATIGTAKRKRKGRFVTSLPDGTRFSVGSGLAGRSYTIAEPLYKIKKPGASGLTQALKFGGNFNSRPTFPGNNNTRFESEAGWQKAPIPGVPGSQFFPGGFKLRLFLAGVPYDGKRRSPIEFSESIVKNADITLSGGGLDADIFSLMQVDRRNHVIVDDTTVTLKMSKRSGIFRGTFTHSGEDKPVKFIGLFQQSSSASPTVEQGRGFFRALDSKKTGRVRIRARQ